MFPLAVVVAVVLAVVLAVVVYAAQQALRPILTLYLNYRKAQHIGLPIKVLPVPQGLFSFFAFQLLQRLPLPKLHALLNVGRPDGYGAHKELGDVFVTVNPMGVGIIIADPTVISQVNSKRSEFPKPPNTGAIINLYGRNVINADGDVWRFHRRVTGPAFSERIHCQVWSEAATQTRLMFHQWQQKCPKSDIVFVPALGEDALKLAMNVITITAYGTHVGWSRAEDPPCTIKTSLSYRDSLEQLTAHLFPLFLTPHWLLRLAPRNTSWGRAWEAYAAYGGYMRAMIEHHRAAIQKGQAVEENLLTALITAQEEVDPKAPGGPRTMYDEEVMGNLFIFLFAGHETTANTTHYALLLLALHQDVQAHIHAEIDAIHAAALAEGRDELDYEHDFPMARWALAVMYETLRLYTPTGITNKYAEKAQTIVFEGRTYVIPSGTRVALNGTAAHMNPKVWGENADKWVPRRWLAEDDASLYQAEGTQVVDSPTRAVPSEVLKSLPLDGQAYWTPPPTPDPPMFSSDSAPISASHCTPRVLTSSSPCWASSCASGATYTSTGVLKPPKGAFLPFSEGARACSGKKFATVEFVSVLYTLLRTHRMEILSEEEGWGEERVRKVLSGRKAGALTLQTPEMVPLRFVRK